jgi:hypothetical protein
MNRKRYLDRSLPTLFSFALPIAVLSLWSDVWEFYWLIVVVLFLLNAWYFREVIKRALSFDVYRQMRSALPRAHESTNLDPPGNGEADGFDDIHTGSRQGSNLMPLKLRIFGVMTWLGWFSAGIYFWWFSDTRPIEYLIATVLWILTFLFTALGIPFVQAILSGRKRS